MNSTIDLISIVGTNIIGITLMIAMLISRGWLIHARKLTSTILYVMIICVLAGCIIDPIIFYCDGKPGDLNYFVVYAGNILLYLLNIIVGPCFVTIVYEYVNERISKLHVNLIYILCSLEALLLLLNLFTPVVFYVDDNNVYHRHLFFWVYTFAEVILMFDGVFIYLAAKRKGRMRQYFPVWVFILPIAAGTIVQGLLYGTSLIWPCVGVSVCALIVNLKNEGILIDKLTGVFNRYYLDTVKTSLRKDHNGNFSAVMLDIDKFKDINSQYGHAEGDEALKAFAKILTDEVRSSGAVIRITGDRFFVLLDSFSDYSLSNCKLAIMNAIESYNRTSKKKYKISASIGTNMFNLRECNINELLDSFDKIMTAAKYGYESPVFKSIEADAAEDEGTKAQASDSQNDAT